MIFRNRTHAGQLLAKKLEKYKNRNVMVIGLPRGGVPVAAEIAAELTAPLELLFVRKIGAPYQRELAVGAVCEGEEPIWNESLLRRLGLTPASMESAVEVEKATIERQAEELRMGKPAPNVKGKTVILVDDGLATGATMLAAIHHVSLHGAEEVVVAVPAAAASTADMLRDDVDAVIAVTEREDLYSVGQWYRDFSQVSEDEVLSILMKNSRRTSGTHSRDVEIYLEDVALKGDLTTLDQMKALVIFAHGSGSGRKSPRNQQVAKYLQSQGFGTLLFDLLTPEEEQHRTNVFDISLLSDRLVHATRWLREQSEMAGLPIAYFGASTGGGAAIRAAAMLGKGESVYAIISRGGRPDLAQEALDMVATPVLLLVGGLDREVIHLNRMAALRLAHAEVSIVPGATHLFEEPGTLDEVSKRATAWLSRYLQASPSRSATLTTKKTAVDVIETAMVSVTDFDPNYDRLIREIKDKRVVMLGEASHGTEEFYRIRSLISQRLIQDYGFKFIAVEGDWPDAYRLHRYIQRGEGGNAKNVLRQNHRWPTWMWANDEVVKLAEWMRLEKAGFYGLDVYSLFDSMREVVRFVKERDVALGEKIEKRYACFDPFASDEISYAKSLLRFPDGCEAEVMSNLKQMLDLRLRALSKDEDELFSARQNAYIAANAESYYRAMISGDANSWNVRDGHMMETLDRLLERAGEGAKAIVWAHNTHIGDYRATDMLHAGYVNIGGLARQAYGAENVALVGFGSYEGEVLAGHAWGGDETAMILPPAQKGSYEALFHEVAVKTKSNQFFLMLDKEAESPLAELRGHRAVGVVYDPDHERGNYVPTELSKRYDAFVFVDHSNALRSLHSNFVRGEFPETYPSGL